MRNVASEYFNKPQIIKNEYSLSLVLLALCLHQHKQPAHFVYHKHQRTLSMEKKERQRRQHRCTYPKNVYAYMRCPYVCNYRIDRYRVVAVAKPPNFEPSVHCHHALQRYSLRLAIESLFKTIYFFGIFGPSLPFLFRPFSAIPFAKKLLLNSI